MSITFFIKKHSLDSIVGSSKINKRFIDTDMVYTKTLYNNVGKGLLNISNIDLPFKLRRGTNKRHNGLIKKIIPKGNSVNECSYKALV